MSRFSRWIVAVLIACTMLIPAFGNVAHAQDDARAQLDKTAAAMLALKSFHFQLETTAGATSFQGMFELKRVTGDVVRPSDFQARVDVTVAILSLTLEVVSVDGDIWVKNPLGGSDAFVQLTGGDSGMQLPPTILLNPDQLVVNALNYLDNPTLAGTEKIDGQKMTVVTGTFDPAKIAGGGTASTELGDFKAAGQPLDVKAWIDDQNRLARIDFIGPLFSFEEGTGRLVRSITFSNFDENITIQKPV